MLKIQKSITWIEYIPELFIPSVNINDKYKLSDKDTAIITINDDAIFFDFNIDYFWHELVISRKDNKELSFHNTIVSSRLYGFIMDQLSNEMLTSILLPLLRSN